LSVCYGKASLRAAGFADDRAIAAISVLFPEADDEPQYVCGPIEPEYTPSEADLAELSAWSAARDRELDEQEAHARADVAECLDYCTVCGRSYEHCLCQYNPFDA
jgi:hypothetical protein